MMLDEWEMALGWASQDEIRMVNGVATVNELRIPTVDLYDEWMRGEGIADIKHQYWWDRSGVDLTEREICAAIVYEGARQDGWASPAGDE